MMGNTKLTLYNVGWLFSRHDIKGRDSAKKEREKLFFDAASKAILFK
jgi:hypothetical protein